MVRLRGRAPRGERLVDYAPMELAENGYLRGRPATTRNDRTVC